MEQSPFLRS